MNFKEVKKTANLQWQATQKSPKPRILIGMGTCGIAAGASRRRGIARMTDRKVYESDVEARLVKRVAEEGGVAEKFTSPNRASVPDRLILWPSGRVEFVECKAPGKEPTSAQLRDHERRRAMGFRVTVIDSFEAVDWFIKSRYMTNEN